MSPASPSAGSLLSAVSPSLPDGQNFKPRPGAIGGIGEIQERIIIDDESSRAGSLEPK